MMCLWTTLSTRDPLQGSTRLQCKCGMLVGRTIEHLVESDLVKKKMFPSGSRTSLARHSCPTEGTSSICQVVRPL